MNEPAIWALIGTTLGAAVLKILDAVLGQRKISADEAAALRDDLLREIDSLRKTCVENGERIARLSADLDNWKRRYYRLQQKYNQVIAMLRERGVEVVADAEADEGA